MSLPAVPRQMALRLDTLPTNVLVQLCMAMRAQDLAALEAVARHFWRSGVGGGAQLSDGAPCSVPECAAEQKVLAHGEGWRVAPRAGESWKFVLATVLEGGLLLAQSTVVAAGGEHTLVRTADGRVVVFGHDRFRQLGLGQRIGSDEMRTVAWTYHSERREPVPQELERLRASRVAGVACCHDCSCAVTEEGKLLTWGKASSGGNQLGHGPLPGAPNNTFTVVAAPRLVTGGFPNGTRVAMVAVGGAHMACVSALGEVYSWGLGGMGQLGHGEDALIDVIDIPRRVEGLAGKRIVGLDCGQWVTLVLASSGEVFEFGCDDPGGGVSEKHLT
eukprot:COSAG06_NODE_10890_length_1600_cov_2.184544_2_plen_330_part_01